MRTPSTFLMYGLLGAMSDNPSMYLQPNSFFTTNKSSDHYLKCDLTPKQKSLEKNQSLVKKQEKRIEYETND